MRRFLMVLLFVVLSSIGCSDSKSQAKSSNEKTTADIAKTSNENQRTEKRNSVQKRTNNEFSISQYKGKNPVLILSSMPKHSRAFLRYSSAWLKVKAEFEKHGVVRLGLTPYAEREPTAILFPISKPSERLPVEVARQLVDQFGSYTQFN